MTPTAERSGPGSERQRDVTVKDVAARAEVAVSSASRVLAGHRHVSQRMIDRVTRAADELGYEPNFLARTLRVGSSRTLGFLVADLANPIAAEVIRGAEDEARLRGYGLLLTNSEGDPRLDEENFRVLVRRKVDALIMLTGEIGGEELARLTASPEAPVVLLDRDAPPGSNASAVYFDHAAGMREATSHLLDHGHVRIAVVGGPSVLRPIRERLAGIRSAHRERGLELADELVRTGTFTAQVGRAETLSLLGLANAPTALVVSGNRLLTGVLEAVRESGRRIGEDLAIVISDDVDLARVHRPPISSILRDLYRAGQVAAELAIDGVESPDATVRSVYLGTSFVARESTTSFRVG